MPIKIRPKPFIHIAIILWGLSNKHQYHSFYCVVYFCRYLTVDKKDIRGRIKLGRFVMLFTNIFFYRYVASLYSPGAFYICPIQHVSHDLTQNAQSI